MTTNNLFNGLQLVSGEVKVETLRESFGLEVNGAYKMIKGNFEQEFSYYARLYKSNYENYVGVDDYNVDDEKCNLGGLPIDNIDQLKRTLSESGLSTLASSIGFTEEEKDKAMYQTIQNHKDFIKCYGKKTTLWDLLSKEEQKLVQVKHVIDNYDTCQDYQKSSLCIVREDEFGNTIKNYVPTLEEVKELAKELKSLT